jgi:metallophosphoesterase superfamily enzyme
MSRPAVEPVAGAPAATVTGGRRTSLVVADYHAGIEAGLRRERGVELADGADRRRERLVGLLARTGADRLVVVGDLAHRIGDPDGAEGAEIEALLDALDGRVETTLVPGNHDGGVADAYGDRPGLTVAPASGAVLGDVGFCHGHTWPDPAVLAAGTVCLGHEHPAVRLSDDVGGSRVERAWLRGRLRRDPFVERGDARADDEGGAEPPSVVVLPAFNDVSGGTWVNVEDQDFLAPFLPDALDGAEAYLLDGTRLGDYRAV